MMLKLADINARIQGVKQKLDEKAEKILDDQIVKDCKSVKLEYHVDPEISSRKTTLLHVYAIIKGQ